MVAQHLFLFYFLTAQQVDSIIFFIAFLSYIIQVLGSLLKHSVSNTQEIQGN